jgi:hypothetical protein
VANQRSTRNLPRVSLATVLSVYLGLGGGSLGIAQNPPQSIRVNVIQGEGISLTIGSGTPRDVVIEVTDSNGRTISGASVSFILGSGGTTLDDLTSLQLLTDAMGRATARVRPTGQSGQWTIRVTASFQQQLASATVTLTNVTAAEAAKPEPVKTDVTPDPGAAPGETPVAVAPATPPPTTPPPPPKKKSNKTLLILLIVAGAGGAGAAAALAGGHGSSSSSSSGGGSSGGTTPPPSIGISLGTGTFGTPSAPH